MTTEHIVFLVLGIIVLALIVLLLRFQSKVVPFLKTTAAGGIIYGHLNADSLLSAAEIAVQAVDRLAKNSRKDGKPLKSTEKLLAGIEYLQALSPTLSAKAAEALIEAVLEGYLGEDDEDEPGIPGVLDGRGPAALRPIDD